MSRKERKSYAAPALSKGLEILELLSRSPRPLSQGVIARELGRSVNEQFRMLSVLQERGYVRRDEGGGYQLTLKLFSVGNGIPVLDTLVTASSEPMRVYVQSTGQECHLSHLEDGLLVVLAQEMGTTEITLHVRKGIRCNPFRTASGRLLLSRLKGGEIEYHWSLARSHFPDGMPHRRKCLDQVEALRGEEFSRASDESLVGLSDCARCIIGNGVNVALASSWFHSAVRAREVKCIEKELRMTCSRIEENLGLA